MFVPWGVICEGLDVQMTPRHPAGWEYVQEQLEKMTDFYVKATWQQMKNIRKVLTESTFCV